MKAFPFLWAAAGAIMLGQSAALSAPRAEPPAAPTPADPASQTLTPDLERQARELLRKMKVIPGLPVTNPPPPLAAQSVPQPPPGTPESALIVPPGAPATSPPAHWNVSKPPSAPPSASGMTPARQQAIEEAKRVVEERKANNLPLVDLRRQKENETKAEAERQSEIERIETELLRAAEQRKQQAAAAANPAGPAPISPAPPPAMRLGTPPVVTTTPSPGPASTGSIPDWETKARALLAQRTAELTGRQAPSPVFSRPETALVLPTAVAPPAPTPAPPVAVATPARPTPPRSSTVPLAEPQVSSPEQARMEAASQQSERARTVLREETRNQRVAEQAAGNEAVARQKAAQRSGITPPPPVQSVSSAEKAAMSPKERRLAELLEAYTRERDPLSPAEYHRQRARVLSEP